MPANFYTGAKRSRVHHCKACKGSIKASCYTQRHVAVCRETLKDGRPCGETFTVISKGCFKHPYLLGFNQGVKTGEVCGNKHMKAWSAEGLESSPEQVESVKDDSVLTDESSESAAKKVKRAKKDKKPRWRS